LWRQILKVGKVHGWLAFLYDRDGLRAVPFSGLSFVRLRERRESIPGNGNPLASLPLLQSVLDFYTFPGVPLRFTPGYYPGTPSALN
jgi:hypothetical protein